MEKAELYIKSDANYIKIQDLKYGYPNDTSDDSHDRNWLLATVNIKAGKFSGKYTAYFQTTDFSSLKNELEILHNNLNGTAKFSTIEEQLGISFTGDGLGHFEVDCTAIDEPGNGVELNFTFTIDQTEIKSIVNQLIQVTLQFPFR